MPTALLLLRSRYQLSAICFDLWVAGQETTSVTMRWGLLYMIMHPEVQAKVVHIQSLIPRPEATLALHSGPERARLSNGRAGPRREHGAPKATPLYKCSRDRDTTSCQYCPRESHARRQRRYHR